MNEAAVDDRICLEHPRVTSGVLWRNNVGALTDARGVPVRYGLANDSKKMNEMIKSSDRIGGTPTLITPQHVGQVLAVLTAVEVKASDWTFPNPTNVKEYKHCLAQQRFIDIVLEMGGYAGFATNLDDYYKIVRLKP